jgi:hypothetical protein
MCLNVFCGSGIFNIAHLHILDRGDSLQVWQVAVIILNKCQTPDKGCSRLDVGEGLTTPTVQHNAIKSWQAELLRGGLDFYGLFLSLVSHHKRIS